MKEWMFESILNVFFQDILKQIEVNMNEMKGRLDSVDKENVHLQ